MSFSGRRWIVLSLCFVVFGCNVYDGALLESTSREDGGGGAGGKSTSTTAVGAGGPTGGASGGFGGQFESGVSEAGMAGRTIEAGSDSGPGCPTGVLLIAEHDTRMYGGFDRSDTFFADACPDDGPVIGYRGYVDTRDPASIGRIGAICGQLSVSPSGCQIAVSTGTTLPMRGQYGDVAFTQTCPADQVVVGFRGRSGYLLDQVGFICAPLVVSTGATGFKLSIGTTTALTPAGGTGGDAFQDGCPAGQIARGSNVTIFVEGIVDAFGLMCGTPSLTGP